MASAKVEDDRMRACPREEAGPRASVALTAGQVAVLRRACRRRLQDRALRTTDDRLHGEALVAAGLATMDWRPLDKCELAFGVRHAVLLATPQGVAILDEFRRSLA